MRAGRSTHDRTKYIIQDADTFLLFEHMVLSYWQPRGFEDAPYTSPIFVALSLVKLRYSTYSAGLRLMILILRGT